MIFHENRFSCNIIPYFCQKFGKMSQKLSSAAVVIGALRVSSPPFYLSVYRHQNHVDNIYLTKSLEPDQTWQNIGPGLDPNCFTILWYS